MLQCVVALALEQKDEDEQLLVVELLDFLAQRLHQRQRLGVILLAIQALGQLGLQENAQHRALLRLSPLDRLVAHRNNLVQRVRHGGRVVQQRAD